MPRSCSDSLYVQLVYEYLLHMGLESTAASLKDECSSNNYPVPEEICGVQRKDINILLEHFDGEDEAGFMKKFHSSVPPQAKSSLEGKRITADLLVYFAALTLLREGFGEESLWMKPLVHAPPSFFQNCESSRKSPAHGIYGTHSHTSVNSETLQRTKTCQCCGQKICHNTLGAEIQRVNSHYPGGAATRTPVHPCMNALLEYLERECGNLHSDPYFIPYFALPFVANPQSHSDYKHIFQGSWLKSLRRRLWDFLVHNRQAAALPSMVRLLPSEQQQVTNQ